MQITTEGQVKETATAEEIFHMLLANRGYTTEKEQDLFLHPPAPTLQSLLRDTGIKKTTLAKMEALLEKHLVAGHDICVFGDYDADGITATAVLWQALVYLAQGRGVRILPFLPDRLRHGYGLSVKAIEEMVSGQAFQTTKFPDFAPELIITVDNGIVAHAAAEFLQKRGIDLVITDHHEPAQTLPAAKIIIHTTKTSGAGIAWIIARALLHEHEFATKLIDLATIGIVADMMPLVGLNRGIVVQGLSALSHTRRPGLLALYEKCGIVNRTITTYDINFGLAPRINAAGRLYDPYDALRLLCATDRDKAVPLAEKIQAYNTERQLLTDQALQRAKEESFAHKIVVVSGEYHEGIIGLVAGKLTELLHKPVVVISQKETIYKASARSIPAVHITDLLRSLKTPYLSLGGHAAAAGFSLDPANFTPFLEEIRVIADQVISDEAVEKKYTADLELTTAGVTLALAKQIESMEPFGLGNQKPRFLFKDLSVIEDRELGKEGKHRKLFLANGQKSLELVLFNTKSPHPLKKITQLIATIEVNTWRERETVQLIGSYVEV